MKWPTLKCPFCAGILRNTEVYPGRPLVCPACQAQLQPSDKQLWMSVGIALLISVALAYLVTDRWLWLLVIAILLWFPISIAWHFLFVRIVPPKFEAYIPKDQTGTELF